MEATKTTQNPCLSLLEGWLHNPLPDIALQDMGLCILSKAFELYPELNDDNNFVILPMNVNGTDWLWDKIDPDTLEAKSVVFTFPTVILTNATELVEAGRQVGLMLTTIMTAADGIVKGSVRLHIAPDRFRAGWLEAGLIWIGAKHV